MDPAPTVQSPPRGASPEARPAAEQATQLLATLLHQLRPEGSSGTSPAARAALKRFMVRLLFCLFGESLGILPDVGSVARLLKRGSGAPPSATQGALSSLFRALSLPPAARSEAGLPDWTGSLPQVDGDLFRDAPSQGEVPPVDASARRTLLQLTELDWRVLPPDILGSMMQGVADARERGALGVHYTSGPNILKALNPLFLDELRAELDRAGTCGSELRRLRRRLARIRVFDPACGSGNFLVLAYQQMRALEAELNRRCGEPGRASELVLTNFQGIELRPFTAEVARLALRIAEVQCDRRHRPDAPVSFERPPGFEGWIPCGNALQEDWTAICPPASMDGEERAETYICGNPPYRGSKWQSDAQKRDMASAWHRHPALARKTDYATGWLARFFDYLEVDPSASAAFVVTNSLCQGQQATELWPVAADRQVEIRFAHTSFKWANRASQNAGVTVIVVGLGRTSSRPRRLYDGTGVRSCGFIGPYLIPDSRIHVRKARDPIGPRAPMRFGNMPRDGGHLLLSPAEAARVGAEDPIAARFLRPFLGSSELIRGRQRYCLWIPDDQLEEARQSPVVRQRLAAVAAHRRASRAPSTRAYAQQPHRFVQIGGQARASVIVVPRVSSELRSYLPVDVRSAEVIVGDRNFALYDAERWNLALLLSRLHRIWIGTVCVRLEMRLSYSNTLGWNTFPIPSLDAHHKESLRASAEDIRRTRARLGPASLSQLYEPGFMPAELEAAHARNDVVVEELYGARSLGSDAARREHLFALYEAQRGEPSF